MMCFPGGDIKRLIGSSFRQYQLRQALPGLRDQLAAVSDLEASTQLHDEGSLFKLQELLVQGADLWGAMRQVFTLPGHALPFMQPGRLVRLAHQVPVQEEWQEAMR